MNAWRVAQHVKSGRWYLVVGTAARSVEQPQNVLIVYRQLYQSRLRGGKELVLPFGSVWVRDRNDFERSFRIQPSKGWSLLIICREWVIAVRTKVSAR